MTLKGIDLAQFVNEVPEDAEVGCVLGCRFVNDVAKSVAERQPICQRNGF